MQIEDTERLEELPLFPLAVVLFPGAILPLHIFEERYKAMMRFAIENGAMFGLSYHSEAEVDRETIPDIGSVGCVAKINAVMPLEEGRLNMITTGVVRYRVVEMKQLVPFLIARVEAFTDEMEMEEDLTTLMDEVAEAAKKFFAAAQLLNDMDAPADVNFPEEAEELSLFVAAHLPIDNDAKQMLLEMTSTKARLLRVKNYLIDRLPEYTRRVETRNRAKGNGHGRMG
jgi:Lon protease-like protein